MWKFMGILLIFTELLLLTLKWKYRLLIKHLLLRVISPFLSDRVTYESWPCMSVNCASISIHSNNHKNVYSILFFYLVPEFQHVEPVGEVCLNWHSFLVTAVLLVYPTLSVSCVVSRVVLPLLSIPIVIAILHYLVPAWVPACWASLWGMPPLASIPSNNCKNLYCTLPCV